MAYVQEIVDMTERIMKYYHAQLNKEDAADHTYQLLQRTLQTKPWYKEDRFVLHGLIAITTQYVPEYRLCCDYYEYILYCIEKEDQQKAHAHRQILMRHQILQG